MPRRGLVAEVNVAAGIFHQRHADDIGDEPRQRDVARSDLRALVLVGCPVVQARRVQQQILYGDLASWFTGRGVRRCDPHLLELREVLRHRIVQREAAFFEEHHYGDGRHRLAHRVDPEDRPLAHGDACHEILNAHRLEIGELSLPGDSGHRAGNLPLGDEAGQEISRFAQPRGRETNGFRRGARNRLRGRGRHHQSEQRTGECENARTHLMILKSRQSRTVTR